jgi:thiol-disulfide isomerase/thioredoxin
MSSMKFTANCFVFIALWAAALAAEKTGSDDKARKPLLGVVHTQAPRGVLIQKIMPDSAAERAGLRAGDVILSVNKVEILSTRQLFTEIQKYSAGTVVAVEFMRGKRTETIQVSLGERLDTASLSGERAPAISLPLLNGKTTWSLPKGKVVILDFWATWCGPCEGVRHALEDFRRNKENSAVEIAGITNEDMATVKAFYRNRNPPYAILIDEANDIGLKYRVAGYPTLVVIDAEGVVRFAGFASGGGLEEALATATRLAKKNREK